MPTHAAHAATTTDPLKVTRIVQCGQHRHLDAARGIDLTCRHYRFEPPVSGNLYVAHDDRANVWVVTETFGTDIGGHPLISLTDLTAVTAGLTTWTQMEAALATYFKAPVCEAHHASADGFRVRAKPPRVDEDGSL